MTDSDERQPEKAGILDEKQIRRADRIATVALLSLVLGIPLLIAGFSNQFKKVWVLAVITAFVLPPLLLLIANHFLARACRSRMKSLVSGMLCIYLLMGIFMPALARDRASAKSVRCSYHLNQLANALSAYVSRHNGVLPIADRWCDLLLEDDNNLSADLFKSPVEKKGRCHFAMNNRVSGRKLSELPLDTVLLFDAVGGWNCNGGPEIIAFRHNQSCHILLAGSRSSVPDYCTAEQLLKDPPCWQP